ncbi:MAG: hypothetical protein HY077_04335 [Elusimicrobia bacterium]|nr:hypothetical protein [Elusimicrobiota bacterium]
MEELEDKPQRIPAWRSAVLVGAVVLVLAAPLVGLLRRRQAVIPEREDGFAPITQLTGREREVPRFKLALPPEPPKPKPAPPAPVLAAAVSLPARPVAPPRPPKPVVVRAAPVPMKKRPVARPKLAKRKPAPKVVAAAKPAAPPAPPAAKPQAQPAPVIQELKSPRASVAHGRRALSQPELAEPVVPAGSSRPVPPLWTGPAIIVEHVSPGEAAADAPPRQ